MDIYKQITLWGIAFAPVILVLGYGIYEFRKSRALRKRNREKLADFNNLIAQALKDHEAQ